MHSRVGRHHRQYDWPKARASPAGRFRRGNGVCSKLDHVVCCGANCWLA